MIFTKRFNEFVTNSNIKSSIIAEKLCISRQAISNLKNGSSLPSLELLYRICDEYDISSDYLLGLSEF